MAHSRGRKQALSLLQVLHRSLGAVGQVVGWLLLAPVRTYQLFLSPLMPPMCRFRPSCSHYMIEAIRKKGPIIGLLKGIWRLLRCNPLFPGGYDPVE